MPYQKEAKKTLGTIMLSEPRKMRLHVILTQKVTQVVEFRITTETMENGVPDIQETNHQVLPLGSEETKQLRDILETASQNMFELEEAMVDS